jgi:hypothetical protein
MLTHHFDGILFGIAFALLFYSLPGAGWLKGLIYGAILWLVVLILIAVTGMLGAEIFKGVKVSAATVISNLLIHLLYGFILGLLYVPETNEV